MAFVPRPAPLPKRVIAGLLDFAFILVLSGISFAVPLLTRGIVLPMWGVLAVMVGYAVVPLAFLKRTLGLHIMGLELVGRDGHPVDLANVLFRELLGRGFFPAAWLFTIIASLVARYLGVGGSTAPPLLAGVMTVACAGAFCIAAIGHVIALGRPDQRTLADLVAKSFVVEGPSLPPPTDLEEFDEWKAQRTRLVVRIGVFEVALMSSVLLLPWLLTSSSGESPQMKVARLKLESLQAKFDADPGSESLAAELQREYWRLDREAEVQKVIEKHRKAQSLRQAGREQSLRQQLAERHDRDTAEALIELLERQDRVDDAVDVYREWLGPTPQAPELAGFGNWLATNNRTELAVVELERATSMDPLVPLGHTLLGACLQRLGRLEEAREHLELALLDDPDDADADDTLRLVEGKIGRLPGREKLALQRRVDAWRRDAGR
ncbi:MAG: RDD family protein [Archangium sp.]|nr:RDD family protein [Archangium sp.]